MTAHAGVEQRFDLIVLGAGPAGAACAKVAATAGLTVALVDKARFPRDKLCGGGLTGRAMGHHRAIFEHDVPQVPHLRRETFTFFAFGEDLGPTTNAPPLFLIMRRDFDAALVQNALAAGAADFTGQSAELDPQGPFVRLPDRVLSSPLVVAADGVSSPTAKHLFGNAFDKSRIGFALEVEHPGTDADTPLRIDFGAADWGYGWQFPKACGTTIGVGGVLSRNADMKAALARYLKRLGYEDALKVKGQFLPFGAFRKIPGRGRVLLAGDAAGLVDPITGEGIAHALHSGALAAEAAVETLAEGAPDRALAVYRRKLRPIHRGLSQARLLRHVMFRERLRPAFIRSFRRSRTLKADYLRLLAGETEYDEIVYKMLTRLPGFALRALHGR